MIQLLETVLDWWKGKQMVHLRVLESAIQKAPCSGYAREMSLDSELAVTYDVSKKETRKVS